MPGNQDEEAIDQLDESAEFDENETVRFVDEDGKEHECVVLAVVEYEGQDYALLAEASQVDDDGDDVEVYLFEYRIDDEGVEHYAFIEDEKRYAEVQAFCATIMEQDEGDDDEILDDNGPGLDEDDARALLEETEDTDDGTAKA